MSPRPAKVAEGLTFMSDFKFLSNIDLYTNTCYLIDTLLILVWGSQAADDF